SRNHNLRPSHLALLDPPLTVAGLDRPVRVVEFLLPAELLGETFPEEARYLDENFEVIARPRVLSFRFEESDDLPPPSFRRGDVDANGSLNLSDAVRVLNYLFRGGPAPGCFQSADANDDGRVNITDGVVILRHLFQGGRPPAEPFAACGPDPTADTLSCGAFPACP
ncbi:MAG: dockerin type I domain-containing protein, partial [Planctomycetota bacterium]|nr:dockerin type I domain-containing protein [Planctomycetota bacterium]